MIMMFIKDNSMSHINTQRFTLVITLLLLCLPGTGFSQDQAAQTRAQLEQLREQISREQRRLETAQGQRGRQQTALREAEQAVARAGQELSTLDAQLAITQEALQDLEIKAREQERHTQRHRTLLQQQLKAAWRNGQQDRIKLLLNVEEAAQVQRMMVYYQHFAKARADALAEALHAMEALLDTREQINSVRIRQSQARDQQARLRDELELQRQARAEALQALNRSIGDADARLARLSEEEQALRDLLRSLDALLDDIPDASLLDADFAQQRGKLPPPLNGRVRHAFGSDRGTGTGQRWRGVVINAERGTPVRAIHHGRVAFADWMPGFGMLIIVDHGQQYLSLYGFNENLMKRAGDWVQAGDVLAHAGDSGGQSYTGLYFEIRHQGQPVNPAQWWDSKQATATAR